MKILHIIDSGGLYGAEMMLLDLVEEQATFGLSPTIASIGAKYINEKEFETEALKRGLETIKFRMKPGPNFYGGFKILQFAKREGFSLLHSHGYKGNILLGFIPKHLRRIPLITTLHGWTCHRGVSKLRFYEWLDAISLRFMDAIIAVSNDMRINPKLENYRSKLHVVHNGIQFLSPNKLYPSTSARELTEFDETINDFWRGGFTIGAIGRLSPEKDFKNLIEAVSIASQRYNDIKLIIIGEGPERSAIEQTINKFDLQNRVLLPGFIYNAKTYFPHFNIFVLSSLSEGLPITILEAMQAGVPILSTRVGGIPELLDYGNAGLLVDASDSPRLADGICRLHDDHKLRKRISLCAHSIFKEKCSSQRMHQNYYNIYKFILNKY